MHCKYFAMFLFLLASIPAAVEADSALGTPATAVVTAKTARLADVKAVFVAPLGSADGSDLIRQKVINRLVKSGLVTVTEEPQNADAVLIGASQLSKRHHFYANFNGGYGFAGSNTRYSADCAVRLLSKDKRVLWTDEESSRRLFASHSVRGASSNVADKMVNALIRSISEDRQRVSLSHAADLQ